MHENEEGALRRDMLTPRLPRVVLRANSHSGQQGQREQNARTVCDQTSESKSSRGNLEQHHRLQNSWHTPFYSRTAGYKSHRMAELDYLFSEPDLDTIGVQESRLPDSSDEGLHGLQLWERRQVSITTACNCGSRNDTQNP